MIRSYRWVELSGRGDGLVGGDVFVGVHAGPSSGTGISRLAAYLGGAVPGDAFVPGFSLLDGDLGFPWDLMPTFGSALLIGAFIAQYRLAIQPERGAA